MSILARAALDDSPLADLHTIASELSIDGYRRLRRADLIDAILERQGGEATSEPTPADEPEIDDTQSATPLRRRRGRRGGRGRPGAREEEDAEAERQDDNAGDEDPAAEEHRDVAGEGRGRAEEDQAVEGVVELAANGSGFLRLSPPEPSDDDVYISAAQVKRCELVAGDRVAGPRRPPRRSERFPSLIRIDVINGRPAAEIAEGARFDDLPATFPDEAFRLASDDPTLGALESLAPFGKGSRVSIVGPARAGKTETIRALTGVLSGHADLDVALVLAGVRPEEIFEWRKGPLEPSDAVSFAASGDAQAHTIERVLEHARRIAARGANAVVLIDTLEGVQPPVARRMLAAARNILEGGSLTVIATTAKSFGGETTVVALDGALAAAGRFPAIDARASGTLRPELLVGETGAKAIAKARAKAMAE